MKTRHSFNLAHLEQVYYEQLPTIATLLYVNEKDIDYDDAAACAVELVEAILAELENG